MELEFRLPVGFVDELGELQLTGALRLAQAIDEIEALAHARVRENEAYLPVVVLSRVVTRLGGVSPVPEDVIERLPVRDFQFLERLYLRLNGVDVDDDDGDAVTCPRCRSSLVAGAAG